MSVVVAVDDFCKAAGLDDPLKPRPERFAASAICPPGQKVRLFTVREEPRPEVQGLVDIGFSPPCGNLGLDGVWHDLGLDKGRSVSMEQLNDLRCGAPVGLHRRGSYIWFLVNG